MVSVERMIGYGKLESEGELEMDMQDNGRLLVWPEKGVIELCNVKFKYAMEYPYVLKSISFKIESCEKVSDVTYQTNKDSFMPQQIGIVGRTGAGKSSLLSALFRLAEPEGVFEIDGIQITDIGLHDLRKKISIIPQVMCCVY